MDLSDVDARVADGDLVIPGEGKPDTQTLSGKPPLVVTRRATPVPVLAVVGHHALNVDRLPGHGIERVYALSARTDQGSAADPELSATLLRQAGRCIARTLSAASSTTGSADASGLPGRLRERAG